VLLAEAVSLGITVEDLVAASAEVQGPAVEVPTVAEDVDVIDKAIGGRTAETYRAYWRLLVVRYGVRPRWAVHSPFSGRKAERSTINF